jgi:shikimate kinase/3-dehydroquinate synthase
VTSPSGAGAPPHIVLVGLPGSGKSTVGPLLARALGAEFMDLDREIERRQGLTVSQIFARHGEPAFREMERAITRELVTRPGMVISAGGGWMADAANVALLRPPARIIHLEVSVPTAVARLGPGMAQRPLLVGEAAESRLEALAAARMPLYSSADEAINTENLTPQQVASFGLRLASAWGWPIG